MIELVGERAAVSLFISNLHEQIEAGKVQAAEGAAVARMLDEAGLGRLKVGGRDPQPARLPARGDPLMSFATELTRAAAQRGKLDPVYRELSDDWTLILQRLFPVWALIGPGLAEPGHIELRSRTVYLDSDELLGARDDDPRRRARAARDPAHLRRRDPRGLPRQAHQAVDLRARPRARRLRRRRASASSPPTARCSRSRAWRPTAAASSPPTAAAGASCASRWRRRCSTASCRASPRSSPRPARSGGRSRATWRAAR